MIQQIFSEKDLPMEELEQIGLARNGQLLISQKDLQALVSGRRSDMIRLQNLSSDNFQIRELDAKISFKPNEKGNLDLLIHPIYKEAEYPEFLTDTEAEDLQKGQATNIWKIVKDEQGNPKDIIVEFDPETKEFIITDTEKILIPDMVNSEYLSPEQKERYRKGKEVEIADGTTFQFSGTDNQGVRSNRLALVASIIIDGGLSYMLYSGLNAIYGKKSSEKERAVKSPGHLMALSDMQEQMKGKGLAETYTKKDEYSRGYSRSGVSR